MPQKYICVFCRKVNKQRTNHRRHLVMQHSCRIDGTPATAVDIAQARQWSAKQPTGRSSRYKTQEFVDSDSDDDTTQASGASIPSRRGSPAPSEGRRPKRTRSESSESSSPRRDTSSRRGGSQRPAASASAASRPAPRSAPPAQKQARKVRFEQGETTERHEEGGVTAKAREEKLVKPSATAKDASTTTKKVKADERPAAKKTETEVQQTPVATTSVRMTSPKLDALAAVARQAVLNLKKRESGVNIKEPLRNRR